MWEWNVGIFCKFNPSDKWLMVKKCLQYLEFHSWGVILNRQTLFCSLIKNPICHNSLVTAFDSESSVLDLRRHVGATYRVADLLAVLRAQTFAPRASPGLVDAAFDGRVFLDFVGVDEEEVVDFFHRAEQSSRKNVFSKWIRTEMKWLLTSRFKTPFKNDLILKEEDMWNFLFYCLVDF